MIFRVPALNSTRQPRCVQTADTATKLLSVRMTRTGFPATATFRASQGFQVAASPASSRTLTGPLLAIGDKYASAGNVIAAPKIALPVQMIQSRRLRRVGADSADCASTGESPFSHAGGGSTSAALSCLYLSQSALPKNTTKAHMGMRVQYRHSRLWILRFNAFSTWSAC